jgi:hypothetical protein
MLALLLLVIVCYCIASTHNTTQKFTGPIDKPCAFLGAKFDVAVTTDSLNGSRLALLFGAYYSKNQSMSSTARSL